MLQYFSFRYLNFFSIFIFYERRLCLPSSKSNLCIKIQIRAYTYDAVDNIIKSHSVLPERSKPNFINSLSKKQFVVADEDGAKMARQQINSPVQTASKTSIFLLEAVSKQTGKKQ